MSGDEGKNYSTADLLRVMERLRDPQSGCPWDICQDFHTIVSSTLEECYELAHAIETEDYEEVAAELGDVLFQVIFYAQLGKERDLFTFDTVVSTLVAKLLRRHPHVFAGGEIEGVVGDRSSMTEVKQSWEDIKKSERQSRKLEGVLADVPLALPALPRAQKLQKRAAQANFDWPDTDGVLAKLEEEIGELHDAISRDEAENIHEEVGDLLFTCVNLARHLGVDAETSLRGASQKFEQRFRRMESDIAATGAELSELSEEQLDKLWISAKAQGL